ncbi:MAG: rRNA maturation RNase YbeY [Bacteroidetes bacterium HGW-Bacteroidetes-7]|jgi:rRNA maturation RNase YbeY|nr:MAG: rRNA maturation RNase YbeY [Bacteroidetes bacterium HGW-Bacteroidetes-7]
MIKYFKEDTTFNFKGKRICSRWIKVVAEKLLPGDEKSSSSTNFINRSKVGDINIIFCSDSYILDINNKYLKHNYYTDVITFDYCEGKFLNGDIIISIDTVRVNANLYKSTFDNELHRVIIHAVLHLMGYKDKTKKEKEIMRDAEDKALLLINPIPKIIS